MFEINSFGLKCKWTIIGSVCTRLLAKTEIFGIKIITENAAITCNTNTFRIIITKTFVKVVTRASI